jgi:hypothetical protein
MFVAVMVNKRLTWLEIAFGRYLIGIQLLVTFVTIRIMCGGPLGPSQNEIRPGK